MKKLEADGLDTSILPGPRQEIRITKNMCVSGDVAMGGALLVGQSVNQKRIRESGGHYLDWNKTKKRKVFTE